MTNVNIENDENFYKTTKIDLALIVLILTLSILSIIWVSANKVKQATQVNIALVYHENTKLEEIDMKKDKVITILNGKMQIEVNNGRIRVVNSDCPNHVCEKIGWIKNNEQTIVCIPNHVLIEIKSTGVQALDAITR